MLNWKIARKKNGSKNHKNKTVFNKNVYYRKLFSKNMGLFLYINLSKPFLQQSQSINNLNRCFVQYHVMSERNWFIESFMSVDLNEFNLNSFSLVTIHLYISNRHLSHHTFAIYFPCMVHCKVNCCQSVRLTTCLECIHSSMLSFRFFNINFKNLLNGQN